MIVHYEDRDWEFDLDEVDLNEARYIKRGTGLPLFDFQQGIISSDPDCLAFAYWLMMKQNGEKKVQDPLKINFKVGKFSAALGEAYRVEIERREALEMNGKEGEEGKGDADKVANKTG